MKFALMKQVVWSEPICGRLTRECTFGRMFLYLGGGGRQGGVVGLVLR